MAILAAFAAVAGVLCLIDLILTFGVIRRLREHTELLGTLGSTDIPVIGLAAGAFPATFDAVTADGNQVTGPAGLQLAAFFATGCSACPERVPGFTEYVRGNQIDRARVLAVVLGDAAEPVPYLPELTAVAQVCLEPEDGALARAFAVSGFPAFCLLAHDGAIVASGYDPAALPVSTAA